MCTYIYIYMPIIFQNMFTDSFELCVKQCIFSWKESGNEHINACHCMIKSILDIRKGLCKGPEVETHIEALTNSQEATGKRSESK